MRDTQNFVGLHHEASPGRDRLDVAEAPGIGEHLRVSIVVGNTRFATNFKPLENEGVYWDLEVELVAPEELIPTTRLVNLHVNPADLHSQSSAPASTASVNFPRGIEVSLVDQDRRVAYNMGERVQVAVSPGSPPAAFRLIIGASDYVERETVDALTQGVGIAQYPAYPNPFSANTTLEYVLRDPENVRITIYDVLGRRVRVLENAEKRAGRHAAIWDARDDSGARVAAGRYFARLQTTSFVGVKALVVVR